MKDKPFVLLVDDDPAQEAFAMLLSQKGVDAKHVLPGEITRFDLERANVVLLDEFLTDWPERDRVSGEIGLYVRDGIALAGVLRSALDGRGPSSDSSPRPVNTALVLRTGHLEVLAEGTPAYIRPMVIAGRHDLEWVAQKNFTTPAALAQLAFAASSLPTEWSNPSDPSAQLEWLGLGGQEWREQAIAQIELCRPPWSVLAATSAGRRWLSWFLQKVLPFPTFLVDDRRAAANLGLKPNALDQILEGDTVIASALREARYTGNLADFSGRRWWRAGISSVRKMALASCNGRTALDIAEYLIESQAAGLESLGLKQPVFEIDANYELVDQPLELTQAVRLQPDDWPSYADDPWLAIESIEHEPELAALVLIDDRPSGEVVL